MKGILVLSGIAFLAVFNLELGLIFAATFAALAWVEGSG